MGCQFTTKICFDINTDSEVHIIFARKSCVLSKFSYEKGPKILNLNEIIWFERKFVANYLIKNLCMQEFTMSLTLQTNELNLFFANETKKIDFMGTHRSAYGFSLSKFCKLKKCHFNLKSTKNKFTNIYQFNCRE